jgi:hypothetical protein
MYLCEKSRVVESSDYLFSSALLHFSGLAPKAGGVGQEERTGHPSGRLDSLSTGNQTGNAEEENAASAVLPEGVKSNQRETWRHRQEAS